MKKTSVSIRFVSGPHLRRGDDWHDAYVRKVDRMLSDLRAGGEIEAPAYPLVFLKSDRDAIFEMGAYWEGALYCLYRVTGTLDSWRAFRSVESSLSGTYASPEEKLFDSVWNSHGQMKWLKAYLVRQVLLDRGVLGSETDWSPDGLRRISETQGDSELRWLASFVEQHQEEGQSYHNPYFGGWNPLHLGMILSPFEER